VDPIQDLNDPQQWNAYSYASGSPVTFADPSGLRGDDLFYGPDAAARIDRDRAATANANALNSVSPGSARRNNGGGDRGGNGNRDDRHEKRSLVRKIAEPIAKFANKAGSISGWVPFCGVCATATVAFGVIEALAWASMGEWKKMFKALIGTGVNLVFGGIKITKKLEYLEGGAAGAMAREITHELQLRGRQMYQAIHRDVGRLSDLKIIRTEELKFIDEAFGKMFNYAGNELSGTVPE
jgi:hypothetical protein